MGIMAPPVQPLFADSAAATPSVAPFPKFSGFLLTLFASEYETKAAISPPAPGIAPMIVPITPPVTVGLAIVLMSFQLRNTPEIFAFIFSLFKMFSILLNTYEMANKPMRAGIKGMPSYKLTSLVKRRYVEVLSMPTVVIRSPKKATINPLVMFLPEMETIT